MASTKRQHSSPPHRCCHQERYRNARGCNSSQKLNSRSNSPWQIHPCWFFPKRHRPIFLGAKSRWHHRAQLLASQLAVKVCLVCKLLPQDALGDEAHGHQLKGAHTVPLDGVGRKQGGVQLVAAPVSTADVATTFLTLVGAAVYAYSKALRGSGERPAAGGSKKWRVASRADANATANASNITAPLPTPTLRRRRREQPSRAAEQPAGLQDRTDEDSSVRQSLAPSASAAAAAAMTAAPPRLCPINRLGASCSASR